MAEQAYAYVTLIPVAKGFKSALTKELNGVQGAGNVAGEKTGKGFSGGFGKALGGLAAIAGTALATIGVGKFFKESIIQASDLGESVNAVNVAFGDSAKGILEFGKTSAKELGVAQVDFNNAAVRFSAFAESISGAGNDTSQFIADITSRATDFASVYNVDVTEALQVFQSGLSGSAEPLKRFGINLLDSEVKAYAMANGIGDVGRELTETEKVQARYGLLMESTAKVQGDFANTSDGLANSQRILQSTFKDLQAQVGENLTPVVATFVSALVPLSEKIFPAIADFVNTRIVPGLELFAKYFSDLVLIGTTLGGDNVIAKIFDDIRTAVTGFFDSFSFGDIVTQISEFRMMIFNGILEALPAVVDALVAFLPKLVDFFVNTMLPQLISNLQTVINELISLITRLLPGLVGSLISMIPDLIDAGIKLFTTLVDAVIEITPQLIDAIIYLLPEIVTTLLNMLPQLIDAAIQLFTAIVQAVPKILPPLIIAIIDLLPVIIDTLIDMLPELIDAAFQLFTGIVTALYDMWPDLIGAFGELLPKVITTILGFIPQFFQAGFEIISGLARGIIENGPRILQNAFSNVINGAISFAKGLLGINSPSKVFMQMGTQIGDGLVQGIESTYQGVRSAADGLAKLATSPTAGAMGLSLSSSGSMLGTMGPSVTMPVNRFEGANAGGGKTVNYYAAPNQSLDSEQELFQAMRRAKVVANW